MFDAFPLFPIPLGKINYENHDIIKNDVLNFIDQHPELEVDGISSPELKHYFNTSVEKNHGFFDYVKNHNFNQFLINSALNFTQHVMGLEVDEMIMTDCWLNDCYSGGIQRFHSHGNSFVSGTYYINYDPEKHAHLKFLNPFYSNHTNPFMELNVAKFTDFNHKETICNFIEEGSLILWPSHIDHGYDINTHDKRITLSMNFVPSELRSGPYSFKLQK